jgi:uncharacterized membrane-anchored protein
VSAADEALSDAQVTSRQAISKVPLVTAYFWAIKILTTGMGEAASDWLVKLGGAVTVGLTFVVLVASLVLQLKVTRYVIWVYWFAVVMISVFGTMAADIPHRLGTSLWVTSAAYLLAVLVIFTVWHKLEGTLSFSAIDTRRREIFYWLAVLATFALGTAVGDLTARNWGLGYLAAGIMFVVLIAMPVLARRWFGLGAVPAFWVAYVLTRPLGASFADWMGSRRGGLGMGAGLVALLWTVAILVLICYLAFARKDADDAEDKSSGFAFGGARA